MKTRLITPPPDLDKADLQTLATTLGAGGDRNAARSLLARRPDLVQALGTQVAETELCVIQAACSGSIALEEAARIELADFKANNLRPDDGPLCCLLVERLALCWLALQAAEQRRAAILTEAFKFAAADFWDRHVSRLHGDFLKACRALGVLRRLQAPEAHEHRASEPAE